jgi:hypothetical protein
MASTLSSQSFTTAPNTRIICRLVGAACLAGYLLDIALIAIPINLGSDAWRIAFTQQFSDRGITLLLGLALLIYGTFDRRAFCQRLAVLSLILGVVFNLMCVAVVHDSIAFQNRTISSIAERASQMRERIQSPQSDSNQKITPDDVKKATDVLSNQAESVKRQTRTSVLKTGIASIGNLLIVGLALIGLGQYTARAMK